MKYSITPRGFAISEFEDCYGDKCSIQESSYADEPRIWLGIADPNPQIMKSQAEAMGIYKRDPNDHDGGWTPYLIPEGVLLSTRMHLNKKLAKELIKELRYFVKTGAIMPHKEQQP